MPALKEIRKRIGSVKSTRQITKAMKMIAAVKFRKIQNKMLALKYYAERMNSVLLDLVKSVDAVHPLLEVRPRKKVEIVALTGDRGLCGAFTSNVMKALSRLIKEKRGEGLEVSVSMTGKRGVDLFIRRGGHLRRSWVGLSGRVTYTNAQAIAMDIGENYLNETFDEVILLYNEFRSAIAQKVVAVPLLPLAPIVSEGAEARQEGAEFLYEPSQQEIFNRLLPKNIEIQVFSSLLESQASEEAARMTAMENATKAAGDMIDHLTLQYNKARQASITAELMDIVGGVEAIR
ncbi:ATP synthase F1 subunit gamma [Thermodesulfovibrionales bacterium]|nr:ATP synthase F1 subunit gamma [Thermodesulfovibrionales bacterium]MCL0047036.1 ATP synthase F1 subunit gamma [Thermodesulfovibrionales bacterium]MCL0085238.1 ATP synthase F1 subunit gamma [Thermodesulfovibrionales bacterium]MCL0107081.1 ATP synthase F1 subunit gamma [Thermodesulfovibrionales bacterium]